MAAASARHPSTTTSVPRALTRTSGSTGAIAASSAVTASANPGAWPMPPPRTISDGSMTAITQQIAAATRRASPATTAAARSSPAAAAAKTSLAVASPVRPARRAARTMPSAPAAVSRVPRRRTSSGSMITPSGPAVTRLAGRDRCAARRSAVRRPRSDQAGGSPPSGRNAISPATPCTPRCSRPPSTRPMPMPVPTCTHAKLSASCPTPSARSASAAASTSFSIASAGPNAARSPASASGWSQPGRPPVSAIRFRCGS